MSTIDQRIVEMKFDNKQFESNVQDSMSTIDKLKQSLNFTGAAKGLDGISDAARKVDMSGLSDAVESVRVKFSALQVMAVTVLQDITRSALYAGKKFISSLTIDPISEGFREYELKLNSVQTILANTGSRQKDVTKQMNSSNAESLKNLQKTNAQKLKEYDKLAKQEMDVLRDTYEEELDLLEDIHEEHTNLIAEKYEQESEALEKAIDNETKALRKAHREKLALYNDEYMAKLKATDEERYNVIKSIEDQIDSINNLTKAEDEELERKKQAEKLAKLQKDVLESDSVEDRMQAEKRLSEYRDEIARKQLLKERNAQIDKLKSSIASVDEEYDLKQEKLKEEYNQQVAQEKELYELESEALKENQNEREKLLKKSYELEKKLLKDQQKDEKAALQDIRNLEIENLKERQNEERDALKEIHDAEVDSMKARHSMAISNIKDQKNALEFDPGEAEFTDATTLEEVNKALDELNEYADRTIYNFAEMTRNIGTFTAAGVDLDTSVSAIKGIANLAAVSGSTSQQASTAMYQLSQALAAGSVKLMDWNSVVNAGMGGMVFQDALKETARLHGIAIDEMIASEGSFRETLSKGWLTSEVLTDTLSKFTGDLTEAQLAQMGYTEEQILKITKLGEMANNAATEVKTYTQLIDTLQEAAGSGWAMSWELILGDFGEAKKLWTEVSKIIGGVIDDSSDARNQILSGGLTSGWKQLLSQGIDDVAGYKDAISEIAKTQDIEVDVDGIMMSLEEASKYGVTFEETLKQGWLTADIMSDALENLTAKTRGLSDEQLTELGYTREQINNLELLNTRVQKGSFSLERFAEKMTKNSGRENLIDALFNSFKALQKIITPIKEAFDEIFPAFTAKHLYSITESIKNFTEKIQLTETASENLKRTFKGLFAVVDIIRQVFVAVFNAITPLFGGVTSLGGGVLSVTAYFGDWLVKLNETLKSIDIFNKVAQGAVNFITLIVTSVKNFIRTISDKIKFNGLELFHSLLERIHARMSQVGKVAGEMKSGIELVGEAIASSKLMQVLQALWKIIKIIAGGIVKVFGSLTEGLVEKIGNADFSGILDILNSLIFGGIGVGVIGFLKSVTDTFKGFQDITEGVVDIFDGVRGSLEAFQTQLKAGALLKIAFAIAILAGSILIISLIDSEKLLTSLGAITVLFTDLMASMAIFSKISGNTQGVLKSSTAMIAISVSILILATALKKVSDLDIKQLAIGVSGIAALSAIVIAAAKIMGSSGKTVIKGAVQMVIFAAAIKILASVCEDLSKLSWGELAKGLTGVGVLMAEIVLFLNTAKFSGKAMSTAIGIVILAAAIKILASASKDFAQMSWEEIGKGLASIGAFLLVMAVFTKLTGNAKHVISTGIALIAIGAAMKIFASALLDLSGMSWEGLARGLVGMASALTAIVIALNLMPKNVVGMGIGLIAVSTALLIMSKALISMGNMTWEEIARGLSALGGSFAILAIGLNAMNGTLAGSAALLVAAVAIGLLTPALSILGAMSWESIIKGLVSLAGAFTIIGVAGMLLGPILPSILGLAGAFALIGVGVLAVGAGLLAAGAGLSAMAIGFTALATAGVAGATAVVASLTIIITGVASLIPLIIGKIGEGIVEFCRVIADSASAIGDAVKAIIITLIDVIKESVPAIVETVVMLLSSSLITIAKYTPEIVQAVFDILIACLKGIADNISMVVETAVDVVTGFIDGIAKKLPDIIDSGFNLIVNFLNGLADGIRENTDLVMDAIFNLFSAVVESIFNILTKSIVKTQEIGEKIIRSLGKGIKDKTKDAVKSVKEVLSEMVEKIKSFVSDFVDAGKDLVNGIIKGIKNTVNKVKEAVGDFCTNIWEGITDFFGISSPSKLMAKVGRYLDEGLIMGLNQYSGKVNDSAETVGDGVVGSLRKALSKLDDVINYDIDTEPTIRPVMDLSNVRNGANQLYKMMDSVDGYTVSGSVDLANKAAVNVYKVNDISDPSDSKLDTLNKAIRELIDNPSKFENTFNIEGNNPKEIAEEVSRIIQRQVERREASWA